MFPSFLPPAVNQLTEAQSIALAQQIQKTAIPTQLRAEPIATTYAHQGTGKPAIVLLHGFDSSVFEFRRLLPLLATHQETWAVDLLGFGFSDRSPDLPFSPEAIKIHLYGCWQHFWKEPIVLVGASMGGAAAIDFALTYPQAVAKLVLIDSAGFTQSAWIAQLLMPVLAPLGTAFLRQPKVRHQVSLKAYQDPTWVSPDAECCAALHLQMPHWAHSLATFTKSGGYNCLDRKIPRLTQPTLILWGEDDRILGTRDAQRFQQAIPHQQFIWIRNCGHVPHLEQAQQTADSILAFAASQPAIEGPLIRSSNHLDKAK